MGLEKDPLPPGAGGPDGGEVPAGGGSLGPAWPEDASLQSVPLSSHSVCARMCLCISKDIAFKAHLNPGWSGLEILTSVTSAKTYFQTGPHSEVPGGQSFGGTPLHPLGCEGRASSWGGCEAAGERCGGTVGPLHPGHTVLGLVRFLCNRWGFLPPSSPSRSTPRPTCRTGARGAVGAQRRGPGHGAGAHPSLLRAPWEAQGLWEPPPARAKNALN